MFFLQGRENLNICVCLFTLVGPKIIVRCTCLEIHLFGGWVRLRWGSMYCWRSCWSWDVREDTPKTWTIVRFNHPSFSLLLSLNRVSLQNSRHQQIRRDWSLPQSRLGHALRSLFSDESTTVPTPLFPITLLFDPVKFSHLWFGNE